MEINIPLRATFSCAVNQKVSAVPVSNASCSDPQSGTGKDTEPSKAQTSKANLEVTRPTICTSDFQGKPLITASNHRK